MIEVPFGVHIYDRCSICRITLSCELVHVTIDNFGIVRDLEKNNKQFVHFKNCDIVLHIFRSHLSDRWLKGSQQLQMIRKAYVVAVVS